MFHQFGIYITIIGLTAILVTLLFIIISCIVLKRALFRRVEPPVEVRGELKMVAAASAIYCILTEETPTPKMITSASSSWPIITRMDSLRNFRED